MNRRPALGITATAVAHPAGHGVPALWDAVSQGRTGLHPNDLPWCDLPCWIGTVPGVDASTDQRKLSMIESESRMPSLVSQTAIRSVMISPPFTLPDVTSQPVPPPLKLLEPQ